MPATNPLQPKNSYNNIKIEYITPPVGKNVYIVNNTNYPVSGQAYAQFDGTNERLLINKVYEYTPGSGVQIESCLLNDGSVRVENNCWIKSVNSSLVETNLIKLNATNRLETNTAVPVNYSTYTPTFTPTGSMTFTGTAVKWGTGKTGAYYYRHFNMVYIQFRVDGIIGGTPSASIDFTLPVNAVAVDQFLPAVAFLPGQSVAAQCQITNSASARLSLLSGTFSAGAGGFTIHAGWYVASE